MQAYLVGSVTGRGKEINLANRKTLRMQKEKGKKHILKYCAARVQFISSLPEIFSGAD